MTIDMFRLGGKPLGYDNLVIAVDPYFVFDGKTFREYLQTSEEFLAELDTRGVYLVRPEFEKILKKHNIPYRFIAKYPMPKEVREQIRRRLKKNGVSSPL